MPPSIMQLEIKVMNATQKLSWITKVERLQTLVAVGQRYVEASLGCLLICNTIVTLPKDSCHAFTCTPIIRKQRMCMHLQID